MSETTQAVYAFLDQQGIAYRSMQHAPTFSIKECAEVDRRMGALIAKNIFLCTKNGKHFYLCLTHPNARFRTADISKQAGSSRLSFAPEESLLKMLRAHAGSASPLGLIFDEVHCVKLLVDSALLEADALAFHPCDNTETIAMARADFFEKFLPAAGVVPQFVEIHDFMKVTLQRPTDGGKNE